MINLCWLVYENNTNKKNYSLKKILMKKELKKWKNLFLMQSLNINYL